MIFSLIELEANPGSNVRSFLVTESTSKQVTSDNWLINFKHGDPNTLQDTATRYLAVFGVVAQFALVIDNESLNKFILEAATA